MIAPSPHDDGGGFGLRAATARDGVAMWRLACASGALEPNTPYAYLLLATHFASTCLVAASPELPPGELAGFVAAYRPPSRPDAVFVWQIGVAAAARGRRLASRLLDALVALPACREVRFLEATVAPSNTPSTRLFKSFARAHGVPCEVGPGFTADDFAPLDHEAEPLFRIGPLKGTTPA